MAGMPRRDTQPQKKTVKVVCFLDFQATKEVPKKTQYPETERRVVAHVAQSESENA